MSSSSAMDTAMSCCGILSAVRTSSGVLTNALIVMSLDCHVLHGWDLNGADPVSSRETESLGRG